MIKSFVSTVVASRFTTPLRCRYPVVPSVAVRPRPGHRTRRIWHCRIVAIRSGAGALISLGARVLPAPDVLVQEGEGDVRQAPVEVTDLVGREVDQAAPVRVLALDDDLLQDGRQGLRLPAD